MEEITYIINNPENISEVDKKIFLELLTQQNKVTNPTMDKINRCSLLCFCKVDNSIVSIGAIKPKTNSDFNIEKADLEQFRNDFELELGYCFTLPNQIGKGFSSSIVNHLLGNFKDTNLMASTEIRVDNSMISILERNNFKHFGKPWKSTIHNGTLGLFLKFVK